MSVPFGPPPMAVDAGDEPPGAARTTAEAAAAVGAAGLIGAFAMSADRIETGPIICAFRLATGLPCPGCGLTRSWVYLAHGRWGDALIAHPFGAVAAALVVALIVAVAWARMTGARPPELSQVVRRPWFVVLVVGWVAFAAGRLAFALTA